MTDRLRIFSLPSAAATLAAIGLTTSPLAAAQEARPPVPYDIQAPPSLLATPAVTRVVERKSIVVITTTGQKYEGHFTISGRALVMRDASPAVTVPFEQVARIQQSTFRIRTHALIGLGVGAGVGGLLAAAACTEGCEDDGWAVVGILLISGGIGIGVGAGNGAILNARRGDSDIVFDTSLRSVTTPSSPSSSRLDTAAFAERVEGKDVWITTADGAKRRGEIAVVNGNGLILTGPQHASLPFDQIGRIVEVSHRIRNGMVNGVAAGMSIGLLNCVANTSYEDSDCGASFWGLSGVGLGAGALVGVLMNQNKDRDLLYDSRRKTTTLSFAPILSPTRKGMAFTMTWH
jgi:hypothetical protein